MLFDRLHRVDTLPGGFRGDIASADLGSQYAYDPTPWQILRRSIHLASLRVENFTFVDVGCGKGRVLLSALELPFERIIGIELSPALCDISKENIKNIRFVSRRCRTVEIICLNAVAYEIPWQSLVIFFYNPFPFEVMEIVLSNIVESYMQKIRPIYLIFYGCSSMIPKVAEFLTARAGARRIVSTGIGNRTVNIFELPPTR
jgi:SAM-dependent methyltransferase